MSVALHPDAKPNRSVEDLWVRLPELGVVALMREIESLTLDPELAIACYQAWLRKGPPAEHAVAWFQIASLHQRQGQSDAAIAAYRQALERRDLEPAHFNLGLLLEQQGQLTQAAWHWQRLLASKPEPGLERQTRRALLRLSKLQGQQDMALQQLRALRASPAHDAEAQQLAQEEQDLLRQFARPIPPAEPGTGQRITVLACCFNEAPILPYFLDHYLNFVGAQRIILHDGGSSDGTAELVARYPQVELKVKVSEKLDDRELMQIRNEAWKPYREDCDWMIVCDVDEFLYHPDLRNELGRLRAEGVTLPMVEGFEMLSKQFPPTLEGQPLWTEIQAGFPVPAYYNKNLIFDPRIDINYTLGCHGCQPSGPVVRSGGFVFRNLHYRMLSHQHIVEKSRRAAQRLSDWNKQTRAGFHYQHHAVMTRADYNQQFLKAVNVVNPRPRPSWSGLREQVFQHLALLDETPQILALGTLLDAGAEPAWSLCAAWMQHALGGTHWCHEPDSRRQRHLSTELSARALSQPLWIQATVDLPELGLDLLIVGCGRPWGDSAERLENALDRLRWFVELQSRLRPQARVLLVHDAQLGIAPFELLLPWAQAQGWNRQDHPAATLLCRP